MDDVAHPGRPTLVFDGDCGFCTTSATWAADLLRRGDRDAELVPSQRFDLAAAGIARSRAEREVLWLGPDGSLYGGAEAVAHWLRWTGGRWAVLGRLMSLPVARSVAAAAYRLVARHRHRLPGGTPACALPPTGGSVPETEPPRP